MSLAGGRTSDDRRRRRLAVQPDVGEAAADGEGGLRGVRTAAGQLISVPWVPKAVWKIAAMGGLLTLVFLAVAISKTWSPPVRSEVKPLADHLLAGAHPRLMAAAELFGWLLCGAWCWLIAWFRSQSEVDYNGRYRIWAAAGSILVFVGFAASTGVTDPVETVARGLLATRLPAGSPWISATWMVPLALIGGWVGMHADRDLRRSRGSVALTRFGLAAMIWSTLMAPQRSITLLSSEWRIAVDGAYLSGLGFLFTGLWLQAWYTAYVCADPPERTVRERTRLAAVWAFVRRIWNWGKPTVEESETEEEKPKRTRKRTTKPAAAKKKTSRAPRKTTSRRKAAEEVETAEESGEDWSDAGDADSEWVEDADSESSDEASEESPSSEGNEWEELERLTAPEEARGSDDDEDSSSSGSSRGGRQLRVDAGGDPFRGLSKKQRRELKRQMRQSGDDDE
jgi:hypothetical protein